MENDEDIKKALEKLKREADLVEKYYNPLGNSPNWREQLENGEMEPY